jgi:hypothetical protein
MFLTNWDRTKMNDNTPAQDGCKKQPELFFELSDSKETKNRI